MKLCANQYCIKYRKTIKRIAERITELYDIPLNEAKNKIYRSWFASILDDEEMVYELLYNYDIDDLCKIIFENQPPEEE